MIDITVTCTQTLAAPTPSPAGIDWIALIGDVPTWIAAIASIAIAVALSRRNRKTVHDLALQSVSNQWQQFNMAAITDAKLNKMLAEEEKLSPSKTRELYYVFFNLTAIHQIYQSQKSDSLDPTLGGILVADLLRPLKQYRPMVDKALNGRGYSPEFVSEVYRVLDVPDTTKGDVDELRAAFAEARTASRVFASSLGAVGRALFKARSRKSAIAPTEVDPGAPPPAQPPSG